MFNKFRRLIFKREFTIALAILMVCTAIVIITKGGQVFTTNKQLDEINEFDYPVAYSYDKLGRLKEVTYETGQKLIYTYDSAGNILSVAVGE